MKSRVLATVLLSLLSAGALADGDYLSPTADRVRISMGATRTDATTSFQLDQGSGAPGTVIDGENTLGLDRTRTAPKFEAEVRAGERHRVRLEYFSLDRNDTHTLSGAPLTYGNAVLLPGDPVQTNLSIRAFGLSYAYSFVRTQAVEIAATLGVSDLDVSSQLLVATATRHADVRHNLAGPLPMPGLEATWVLSKRFYLDGHAGYLKGARHQLSASLGEYEVNALYRLRENISFALGYSGVKPDLASRRPGDSGYADLDARGPQLLVRVAF